MKIRTKLSTWGDSFGVRIPKEVADALNLKDGSELILSVEDGQIVLELMDDAELALSDSADAEALFLKINSKNQHGGDTFGDHPHGREVW